MFMKTTAARALAVCATAAFAAGAFAQEATPRKPPGPISADKQATFRQADADGNNLVSYEEASRMRGMTRMSFNSLDTDKNGSLDMNEFAAMRMSDRNRGSRNEGTRNDRTRSDSMPK